MLLSSANGIALSSIQVEYLLKTKNSINFKTRNFKNKDDIYLQDSSIRSLRFDTKVHFVIEKCASKQKNKSITYKWCCGYIKIF